MGDGSQTTTTPKTETDTPVGEAKPPPPAAPNPMARVTIVVLVLAIALFGYHIIADRLTPYTDQATVQAFVVNIAPDVSGRVKAVNVTDNQSVKAGQVLFVIQPERFDIALETAQAQLASAGQAVGASSAALVSAQAALASAEANLANVKQQTRRVFALVEQGYRPKADADDARASLRASTAEVDRAKAEVEKAQQNLGPKDANAQVLSAQAAIAKARRDQADTVVRAPSDGDVTNLQLAVGRYVGAGQTVLTFVDGSATWIDAQVRENSLEHIKVGSKVGIALDARPGRVYPGTVESVGWGVDNRDVDQTTGLPILKNDSGWVREAQRFAVRIRLDPNTQATGVRLGSQASVVVYTGSNPITDAIGRFWIWLVSYLTYLS
jgi:multidrug resistance efflux pump